MTQGLRTNENGTVEWAFESGMKRETGLRKQACFVLNDSGRLDAHLLSAEELHSACCWRHFSWGPKKAGNSCKMSKISGILQIA